MPEDDNGMQQLASLLPAHDTPRLRIPRNMPEGNITAPAANPYEAPERPTQTPQAFLLDLDADEPPFAATDTITVVIYGKPQRLDIHSVDTATVHAFTERLRPAQPRVRGRDGQYITDDVQLIRMQPDYGKKLQEFNLNIGLAYILHGVTGFQVKYQGRIVWDLAAGIAELELALKGMKAKSGMSNAQWISIYNAIVQLGRVQQQEEETSLLGESVDS